MYPGQGVGFTHELCADGAQLLYLSTAVSTPAQSAALTQPALAEKSKPCPDCLGG